ncbi:MAG: hypothetical protein AABY18_07090, partial [Candidatus Thermoplasmatota archaeon]
MPTDRAKYGGFLGAAMANAAVKLVASLIWIYSYVTLGAMMAVAALPGFLLGRWGWGRDVAVRGPPEVSQALDATVGLYFSILGFFVFGLALMFVLPFVKFVFRFKPKVGEIPIHSFKIWSWYNVNGMQFMFNTVFG